MMNTALLVMLASIKKVRDLWVLSLSIECLEFGLGGSIVILRPPPAHVPIVPTTGTRWWTCSWGGRPYLIIPCISNLAVHRAIGALSSSFSALEVSRRGGLSPNRDWRTGSLTPLTRYNDLRISCAHSKKLLLGCCFLVSASLADIFKAVGWTIPNTFERFYNLHVGQVSPCVLHDTKRWDQRPAGHMLA